MERAAEIESLWSPVLEAPAPKARRTRTSSPLVRPFLKWAGGKQQLLPELRKYIPSQLGAYYEPFLGGGALCLALQSKRAVINDTNTELINCYAVVRDKVEDLIAALSQHRNEEAYYYEVRDWDRSPDFAYRPQERCVGPSAEILSTLTLPMIRFQRQPRLQDVSSDVSALDCLNLEANRGIEIGIRR